MNAKPNPEAQPRAGDPPAAAQPPASLLDAVLQETRTGSSAQRRDEFELGLAELATEIDTGELALYSTGDLTGLVNAAIGRIDAQLSTQVDQILHHPKFQRLESTWRGLHRLVEESSNRSVNRQDVKITVLNATREDLKKDLRVGQFRAPARTGLYKKVYESTFNSYGGHPFAAMIGDFEFSHLAGDVELLEKIAAVAAAAHAPFVAAASPQMFGWRDFTDLPTAGDLNVLFGMPEYDLWRAFRAREDSRYVGLTLPRVLTRLPYDKREAVRREDQYCRSFVYREDVDGADHDKYLWGNAAFALAGRMIESFVRDGWCLSFVGPTSGGKVDHLPLHAFRTGGGDVVNKPPTEVVVSDHSEGMLSNLGFIPLVYKQHDACAAFFSAVNCHKPPQYTTQDANANAKLGRQLPYVMAASRIAHYLKVICREELGALREADELRRELEAWLNQYVSNQDGLSDEMKRRRPLQHARIDVEDVPGSPGQYRARAFIRPHIQLDGVMAEISLVAELPKPTG